jgi:hypothetical protein
MATPFNQFGQTLEFEGLGTFTLMTAPFAGLFDIDGKSTISTLSSGGGQSSLVATVKQNGSNVLVGVAGAQGFNTRIQCASGDVITVVLSSSASADLGLNVIKTVVASRFLHN